MTQIFRKGITRVLPGLLVFAFAIGVWELVPVKDVRAVAGDGASSNIQLFDTNANGKIDRITVDIANPNFAGEQMVVNANTVATCLDVQYGGSDIDISGTPTITAGVNPAVLTINLNESDPQLVVDTDAVTTASEIELIYTGAALGQCIDDGVDEDLNDIVMNADADATNTEVDKAAPIIKSFAYSDQDSDGKVDRFAVNFSENVDSTSVLAKNDLLITTDGDLNGIAFGDAPANIIGSDGISSVNIDLGTEATAVDTKDDSSTLAISTQNAFSLVDNSAAANTNSTLGAQTAATMIDSAIPFITGKSYQDSGANGSVDRVNITFTEIVNFTGANLLTDFAITANDLTGFGGTISDITGTGSTTMVLTVSATTNLTGVSGLTQPQIAFTDDTTNHITDGLNNLASFTVVSLSDAANPVVATKTYQDNGADGSVDRVVLTLTENVTFTGANLLTDFAITANGLTRFGGTVSAIAGTGTSTMTLTVSATTNLTGVSGGVEPQIAFTDDTTNHITDGTYNLSDFTVVSLSDSAKPIILTAATGDTNNNGTVDSLALTFSESVTVTDGGTDNDVTLVASTGTATITAGTYGTTGTTLTYVIDVSATANTAITVSPTYVVAGAGSIIDANANEMADSETVAGTDAAKPVTMTALTADNDSNGTVDRLTITFSESVTVTDGGTDDDFALTASTGTATIVAGSYGVTATSVTYVVLPSATSNTSLTLRPTYAVAGAGSVIDANTNEMTNGDTVAGTDGAKPAFLTGSTSDANSDGTVDRLVMTFSEQVDVTDAGTDDNITLVASTGTATVTAGTYTVADATTLTYTISVSATGNTALTITPTYTTASTSTIIDNSANEMLNTETVAGTDGASPAILSSTPADGFAGYSRTGDVDVVFSEAMTTATTEAALSYSPTFGTPTYTWSLSDTALNINPSVTLASSTSYTVTVTTAPSAAAGDSTLSDTITFTSASGTSGGTGGGGGASTVTSTTPVVTLTSPDGGESLTGGEIQEITWTTSGSGIDTVGIYYSADNGSTYNQVAYNLNKSLGTYDWTLPNIDSETVLVKIIAYDSGKGNLDTDVSTAFSISTALEDVVTPAPGEEFTTTDDEGRTVALDSGETGPSPVTGENEAISTVVTGQYVRSYSFNTIYYIDENNERRPFWDTNSFFTYADSFDEVVWVTDATLPTMDLGSPMLPAPGVVLVKIQSDPKVYAIDTGDVLRWVPTEEVAISLYGSAWADYVIDLEPTTFARFSVGDDMTGSDLVDLDIMKTRMELATLAQ